MTTESDGLVEKLRAWLAKDWPTCCDSWKQGGPNYCYNCMCPPEAHALKLAANALSAGSTDTSLFAVKCMARKHADPPQDCDWPHCGCDSHAQRVMDALQEEGWHSPQQVQAQIDALSAAQRMISNEAAQQARIAALERSGQELIDVLARAERACDSDCIEAAADRIHEAQRLAALLSERSPT